jgi:hypothetical protein
VDFARKAFALQGEMAQTHAKRGSSRRHTEQQGTLPVEMNRRPVASLWIGERLHYLNQICLASHLRHGHPVTLYCTHDVRNAPEGVEVRPASEIWDIDMTLVEGTSPAFVANVWRCRMIKQTGAIWVDCDAFCHAPFPDDWDYIFGEHGFRGALNNGVLGMPSDSALLDALLDYYDNLPDYPAWWNPRQKKKMDRQKAERATRRTHLQDRAHRLRTTGADPFRQGDRRFRPEQAARGALSGAVPAQRYLLRPPWARRRLVHRGHRVGPPLHQRHETLVAQQRAAREFIRLAHGTRGRASVPRTRSKT